MTASDKRLRTRDIRSAKHAFQVEELPDVRNSDVTLIIEYKRPLETLRYVSVPTATIIRGPRATKKQLDFQADPAEVLGFVCLLIYPTLLSQLWRTTV